MASTRIYRTSGTPTNDKIFTVSGWFKFHSNAGHVIFGADGSNNTSWTQLRFGGGSGALELSSYSTNWVRTTRLFRDFSAWYHIVLTCDSTQSTAADRIKWWVNGEQITDFSVDNRSSTSLNQSWGWNKNTTVNNIGGENASGYGDFSVAHFHNIDGTAYQASDFGETDSTTGIWKPKSSPSVTYGNNGYFLKFSSSGSMGTDSSGNGNNNTIGGSLTQTQDTPNNVFASINSNWKTYNAQPAFSNLNLTISPTTTAYQNHFSTLGVQGSGKWYAEMKCNGSSNSAMYYGVSSEAELNYLATNSNTLAHTGTNSYAIAMSSGDKRTNASNSSYGSGFSSGDIMMFALDLDNSKVYFGKNGTWFNSGDPAAGTNPAFSDVLTNSFYFFGGTAYTNGFTSVDWNFGNGYFGTTAVSSSNADGAGYGLFEYAPPTGYYSLCTKNINTYG